MAKLRAPGRLEVSVHEDHVVVAPDRVGALLGLTSRFVIPFSTIHAMRATMPEVPGIGEHWLTGFHIPNHLARGRFLTWGGRRRFLWVDARSPAVLVLHLRGHPEFDEVMVELPDPEGVIEQVEAAQGAKGGR